MFQTMTLLSSPVVMNLVNLCDRRIISEGDLTRMFVLTLQDRIQYRKRSHRPHPQDESPRGLLSAYLRHLVRFALHDLYCLLVAARLYVHETRSVLRRV